MRLSVGPRSFCDCSPGFTCYSCVHKQSQWICLLQLLPYLCVNTRNLKPTRDSPVAGVSWCDNQCHKFDIKKYKYKSCLPSSTACLCEVLNKGPEILLSQSFQQSISLRQEQCPSRPKSRQVRCHSIATWSTPPRLVGQSWPRKSVALI
jgi:hypothetical protein